MSLSSILTVWSGGARLVFTSYRVILEVPYNNMPCFSGKVRNVQSVPLRLILPKDKKAVTKVPPCAWFKALFIILILKNFLDFDFV